MAILFITHKFPPSVGGMQKQSYELINGVRNTMKTYVIAKKPTEKKLWFFITLLFRISKVLRRHQDIKVIHCNDGVVASFCVLFLRTSIPITATIHGLDIVYPGAFYQKLIIPRLHKLEKIFAVSDATRLECIKRGFDPDKVKVIYNGVDHELVSVLKEDSFISSFKSKYGIDLLHHRTILSTGRAVKRKGFSWFAKEVLPQLPKDVRYIVVGPTHRTDSIFYKLLTSLPKNIRHHVELFLGYPSDSINLQLALQGSHGKAIHIGELPWTELQQLMAHADLMVMPNQKVRGDMEGFGLVALESGLLGTYVVASDIEGIVSAVSSDKIGSLVPQRDVEAWTSTIWKLLTDSDSLKRKGVESKSYILKEYSWEKMANEYVEAFKTISQKAPTNQIVLPALTVSA